MYLSLFAEQHQTKNMAMEYQQTDIDWSAVEALYVIVYLSGLDTSRVRHTNVLGVFETSDETIFITRKGGKIIELVPKYWKIVPRSVFYFKNGNKRSVSNSSGRLREFKADFIYNLATVDGVRLQPSALANPKKRKASW